MSRKRSAFHAVEPPAEIAREVWGLVMRLFQAEKPKIQAICQQFELTAPQLFLLKYLEPQKPKAMSELAEALVCDASNITNLVDKLEARGLVQRVPDRNDRRVKMIVVTEPGAKFRSKLLERLFQPPECLVSLRSAEKKMLRDILSRALDAAERDLKVCETARVETKAQATA